MKIKRLVASALALVTAASFAATIGACSSDNSGDAKSYTITWYNGDTVLKTTEVKDGGVAASWTPAVKGYTFGGTWYSDKACTKVFDFTEPITADTAIYSTWTEMVYSCSGGGIGSLKANNWTPTNYALKCTVDETNTTYSVAYTITLTMYEGDAFRFTLNGDWDNNDAGIGYVKGFTKSEEKIEGKPESEDDWGTVKEGNEVIFKGTEEYTKSAEHWNITCVKPGIYKFVLGLDENSAPEAIEYTRTGDAPEITETHDMYLIGSFNSWTTGDADWKMTANSDKSVWTGTISVTDEMAKGESGKVELKVYNKVSGDYYAVTSANIQLDVGDYFVQYNTADNSVVFEKCDYYVVGTFLTEDGTAYNFAVKAGVTPAMTAVTGETGKYTATVTATDVTADSDYSWITSESKPGKMAIKCVYGTSIGVKDTDWYSGVSTDAHTASDGNYWFSASECNKEYTVTLDTTAKTFTVTEKAAS